METRLRELRLESGLRQRDVAEKIGVCTASYGFYENWINKPDPETLVKLANLYNVSIDYLLGVSDEYGVKISVSKGDTYTAEERQLIEDFRQLTYARQKLIKDNIKAMLPAEAESTQKKTRYKNKS